MDMRGIEEYFSLTLLGKHYRDMKTKSRRILNGSSNPLFLYRGYIYSVMGSQYQPRNKDECIYKIGNQSQIIISNPNKLQRWHIRHDSYIKQEIWGNRNARSKMAMQHLGCRFAWYKMIFQNISNSFTLPNEICTIEFIPTSSPFRTYTDCLPPRTFFLRNKP